MNIKKVSKRKKREYGGFWLYDENVNNAIKKFARAKNDSKYHYF